MISLEKGKILTPLQKLPKYVGDLGKLIVAKSNKSPNLVTLVTTAATFPNRRPNAYSNVCCVCVEQTEI